MFTTLPRKRGFSATNFVALFFVSRHTSLSKNNRGAIIMCNRRRAREMSFHATIVTFHATIVTFHATIVAATKAIKTAAILRTLTD